jgi:hypothetical protein
LEGIIVVKLLQTIGENRWEDWVLSIIVKIIVKEVDINCKVLCINLITVPYCTRFRITRFRATSEAVDKGIVIYRCDYILSGFNWY